jgi:hypothetical protein
MKAREDLNDFVRAVTWQGTVDQPEFLLYAIRAKTEPAFHLPNITQWPQPAVALPFSMTDEDWPIIVESYNIRSASLPDKLEVRLIDALNEMLKQGAVSSWFMFEGTFNDVARLFTEWDIERTYGIALPGKSATLALTVDERRTPKWRNLVAATHRYINEKFPTLRETGSK